MKKMFSFLLLPLFAMIGLFSLKTVNATSSTAQVAHASSVTCYSTFKSGGSWTITDCGDCASEDNVSEVRDRGTCSTSY